MFLQITQESARWMAPSLLTYVLLLSIKVETASGPSPVDRDTLTDPPLSVPKVYRLSYIPLKHILLR